MDAKELAGAEKPCARSCDNFDKFLLDWCRLQMLSEACLYDPFGAEARARAWGA